MKNFEDIVSEVLLSEGFVFFRDLDYFNKCFVSTTDSNKKIVHDSLYKRFGFFYKDNPIEEAFLIGSEYKPFLKWLKEPKPKNVIELAFFKLKPIIDSF